MAEIRPFRAWFPTPENVAAFNCPPYDVVDTAEARAISLTSPINWMRVCRPEAMMEGLKSHYEPEVYQRGADEFKRLQAEGVLVQEPTPVFYLYVQTMNGRTQRGLVACVPAVDYFEGRILKHELTREDKEQDRIKHVLGTRANTEPVFLTYRSQGEVEAHYAAIEARAPLFDLVTADGIGHRVHRIDDPAQVAAIRAAFAQVPCSYIADGHHRSAAAAKGATTLAAANPNHTGQEEYNFFLAVLFPHDQLKIMDYNRVVKDLAGMDAAAFRARLATVGTLTAIPGAVSPDRAHTVSVFLDGAWWRFEFAARLLEGAGPVDRLDVSLLQQHVLSPMLGIGDPRKDQRIDFIGGIRGVAALQERVTKNGGGVAFAMHPTSMDELLAIADAGAIMPPKSTWFEPKLRSGLFIHTLD